MRIDIHGHFIPPAYLDEVRRADNPYGRSLEGIPRGGQGLVLRPGVVFEMPPPLHDVAGLVKELDTLGIDVIALMPPPIIFHYELGGDAIDRHCRLLNDGMAEVAARQRDRLVAMGVVPLQDRERALAELDRIVTGLGLPAVVICSNVSGRNLDDPDFRPFFARARELGVFVFVHPWFVAGAERMQRYHLWNAVGNVFDTSIAIASLIFAGIVREMPDLKICFAHGGGATPFIIGRIDRAWAVRPEAHNAIPEPPSRYLAALHVDTVVHSQEALAYVVRGQGSDRVLLGSDCPFHLGDTGEPRPVERVRALGLPAVDEARILGGNAARLLGLAR